ncbi:tRNA dihydrouridine synthase DusB [Verrucomicrobiota bacterium]
MSGNFMIGDIVVDPPVALAPMAGYTDRAFRSICKRYHCSLMSTEVINARGIVHDSKMTMFMLETGEDEHPIGAHIYGSEPDIMAEAAMIIEKLNRFDFIDINCGCPVRKIVAKGAGAALIKDPAKLGAIVKAVSEAVTIPVTIKTRLGFKPETENINDVAQAAEEGGASAIAIHARFASNRHSGQADWEALARIKNNSSIPVIGNGGVKSAEDVKRMLSETGVDGVMIGRAAIGNPWIFDEVKCVLEKKSIIPHSASEHRTVIHDHLRLLVEQKEREYRVRRRHRLSAEHAAVLHFRGHLFKYLSGYAGFSSVRRRMNELSSIDDVMQAVDCCILK